MVEVKSATPLLGLGMLMMVVVFSVLLVGQARLEKKLIHENEILWKENMDKTVKVIQLEGKVFDLQKKIEEDAIVEFNPKALTPTEAKRKK
jgi:hypothetical protein